MAIWPFSRKSKRHTIQLDAAAAEELHLSQESRHSFDGSKLGHIPSRKQSKRQKNRHSQPVEGYPSPYQDPAFPSKPTQYPLPSSHTEQVHSIKGVRAQTSRLGHHADGYTSYSTVCRDQPPVVRSPSLLKARQNTTGPAVLKKKLSKRKAYEIAREREIRLMASSPIDIPRRATTPLPADARHRRSDRHVSELSLSIRDSATSSLSEFSETYKFKVNGFAAWTPRPVIRYVEAPPRAPSARSQKTPDDSSRRDKTPRVSASEENFHPRKRVDALADDLDAGGLRELLERDRRRRERKQIEDQEKLQRKLQCAAERQSEGGLDQELPERDAGQQTLPEDESNPQEAENRMEIERPTDNISPVDETDEFPTDAPSSWLRAGSKEAERTGLESMESVHVIGNIDDSSVKERKLGMRSSFAPSQEMGMSTLSQSRSPSRHGLHSPSSSQVYGMGRESTSDLSRTVDSERRMSEHSAGHQNTITSIFRRGSSRLKRRYRERFQERSPEVASTSHESFFKVSAPTSGPPPYVPPRTFLQTGTIKRSQSKFTEHFGDELVSPSESRLQSPDIPEEPADPEEMEIEMENETSNPHVGTQYPIPGSEHRHSTAADGLDGDADNVPLSQSLASIDSEGSWMSGHFLRHISQKKTSNPVRPSIGSLRSRLEEGEMSLNEDQGAQAGANQETTSPINDAVDDQATNVNGLLAPEKGEETWHHEIAKRPVLVTPAVRPKSNEGLLNNVQSLSAEEEFSPIEEHSAEFHLANEDVRENGYGH
ncbi:hypothetical protein FE257_006558 [Aspergillus nanangensis]|uniref:Uncharacterized protein n=1 Tax=Aspergillus nanangensis TaxID=2582783 RepID=A0AAD4CY92_ASPNN|nr:hypothetical protein FE257_006558 [Aspergillus nanangensis]